MQDIIDAVARVKKLRLVCETCFSESADSWGGQSLTAWECGKCHGTHVASSTAHESICKGCSLTYGLCEWCGHNQHMYQKDQQ